MSRSATGRPRLGLRQGLGLPLFSAVLACLSCLNPRPDDQPLVISGSDGDGNARPPAAIDLGAGEDGSDNPRGGNGGPTSTPSDTQTAGSEAPDADAGLPPDAGPRDEPDAGAPDD